MVITFNVLALKQIRDLEKRQIWGIQYLNYCLKPKFCNFEKLAPRGAKFGIYRCQILDTPQIHLNGETFHISTLEHIWNLVYYRNMEIKCLKYSLKSKFENFEKSALGDAKFVTYSWQFLVLPQIHINGIIKIWFFSVFTPNPCK